MDAPYVPVTVVVATRDRCDNLLRSLDELWALPEQPPVIVVDNGSSDDTVVAVTDRFPEAKLVALEENVGAPARNIGVELATTPYVAFADDDSWWAPGSLAHAVEHFESSPRLAVVQARILIGDEQRVDPACEAMASSPLEPGVPLPGPPVLGFIACGAVVRRDAFLEVGGFDDLLFFMGEEQLLALDLAAAGWHLAYTPDVVAHHHPSSVNDRIGRSARQARNALLTTWMRRPSRVALASTLRLAGASLSDPDARSALATAVPRLPEALRRRRRVPRAVERQIIRLGWS